MSRRCTAPFEYREWKNQLETFQSLSLAQRNLAEQQAAASDGTVQGGQSLDLTEALNLRGYFPDTTCVKRHIHFPAFQWIGCYCGRRRAR